MAKEIKKLIFFIIDGFSNYYINDYPECVKGVKEVIEKGCLAEYVKPVFPSFSLPNYYSMFTGLTVEKHGMISNKIYDTEWGEMFDIGLPDRERWFARTPEPLWVTAPKAGIRTSLYWPWFVNYESKLSKGENLYYFEQEGEFYKYHGTPLFVEWMNGKMDKIVNEMKEDHSQFVIVYWPTLDNAAHVFGPRADDALEELKLVDSIVKSLQDKITDANLWNSVDLIIVSDHGQTPVPPENRTFLEDYCPNLENFGAICENEPLKHIYPVAEKVSEVHQMLKNANIPNVKVYLNEEIPDHFEFKKAKCCPPIMLLSDPGHSLCIKSINNRFLDSGHYSLGVHGYDNSIHDMKAVLMARGPSFRIGLIGSPIRTLEYYLFMCYALGLKESQNCDANRQMVSKYFANEILQKN